MPLTPAPASPPPPTIPVFNLTHSGSYIPLLGLGLAVDPPVPPDLTESAIFDAIALGYRHFDTAVRYSTERPLGDAVRHAVERGLLDSRDEVFVTTKLWCGDAHPHLVVVALQNSLRNLGMEYVDLYLIHWPVTSKPEKYEFPVRGEDFVVFEMEAVWVAMEECQRLGLARSIGVSNFSCKKLGDLLAVARIPPAVNQVEVNPFWQQKKLIEFCKANGVLVTAYSPLGAIGTFYGSNRVLECEVLKDIAKAKGKTVAQVSLRWIYEQGVAIVVKSFNQERMKENMTIFDWELNEEDHKKISEIPQSRGVTGWPYISSIGPIKTLEELWDGEI